MESMSKDYSVVSNLNKIQQEVKDSANIFTTIGTSCEGWRELLNKKKFKKEFNFDHNSLPNLSTTKHRDIVDIRRFQDFQRNIKLNTTTINEKDESDHNIYRTTWFKLRKDPKGDIKSREQSQEGKFSPQMINSYLRFVP